MIHLGDVGQADANKSKRHLWVESISHSLCQAIGTESKGGNAEGRDYYYDETYIPR
jgi:hypothetical protein